MRQQASSSGREVILRWTMGAAMATWAAYVLHSEVSGQGIVGWVTDLAVQQFGTASTNLCLLAALAIGVIPIGIVFRLAARAFGVVLVAPRGTLPAGTPAQIRRRAVLGGIAILLAAAGLVAIVLPRPAGSPPVPVDLDDAGNAAPPDAQRVAVMGTPRPGLAAGYRETSDTSSSTTIHRFIPLTPKTWAPGTPVRFFLAQTERSDDAHRESILALPGSDGRTRYEGHLRRNAMATLARGAFERNGVRIAEPYWVIGNDSEQTMGMVLLISCLGFALGLATILTGMRAAKQVAMRPTSRRPPTPPPIPPGGGPRSAVIARHSARTAAHVGGRARPASSAAQHHAQPSNHAAPDSARRSPQADHDATADPDGGTAASVGVIAAIPPPAPRVGRRDYSRGGYFCSLRCRLRR